jgi:hypothetical protein
MRIIRSPNRGLDFFTRDVDGSEHPRGIYFNVAFQMRAFGSFGLPMGESVIPRKHAWKAMMRRGKSSHMIQMEIVLN